MIDLSFGLEYEVELKNERDMDVVIKKFDALLERKVLLDFSYSTQETSFRLAPLQTQHLTEIMDIFIEYYNYNESTTHIHCDALNFDVTKFQELIKVVTSEEKEAILNRLLDITKYKIENNSRAIAYDRKFNMVNIRPKFNTIEYRCFPVTFDARLLLWQLRKLVEIHADLLSIVSSGISVITPKINAGFCSEDIKKRKIVWT